MINTYNCSPEEFWKNSRIPIRVLETEADIYEDIAEIMVETIVNNPRAVFICPVGPINQYPLFVNKVNERKINLKNVWFFNMDEYLDEHDEIISIDNPLSFHKTMNDLVYSKVDFPPNQRLFPIPDKERAFDQLLADLGDADCCLTGVGINGHLAFNEPPSEADSNSRCLDLARETIVNNGARKYGGALDIFPKRCVTVGMKQILNSKVLKIYLYNEWQWGIMRKIALEPASESAPASFLQIHPNSEMVITKHLLNFMIGETK
ncbi:MAG: glucosamine-6-phosphate isomerase [Oscillospiraceae bacterium]|nr:glucosamine-6-phosphate isomerase [Oscillospiraceae bacterium]